MAELIIADGPPMKKPVVANSTAFIAWSLGEPGKDEEIVYGDIPEATYSYRRRKGEAANPHVRGCLNNDRNN